MAVAIVTGSGGLIDFESRSDPRVCIHRWWISDVAPFEPNAERRRAARA